MQFKEIIGQIETKQHLIQMYKQNRLSHALLFLGKEGSGALSLARAFAQYIVCEKVNGKSDNNNQSGASLFGDEPVEEVVTEDITNDSCGVCLACQKAAKLIHPDIHFSFPTITIKKDRPTISNDLLVKWREFVQLHPYGNSYDWLQFIQAENKQGNINAAECNEINRMLSLKSFEAEYKILIMWMPELLGKEGNKLLKLIEEPPPNTLFLFVAQNEQLILQTILSRTQLIKIPSLSNSEIATALVNREGLENDKAIQIAGMSEGNYHEALNQLQHIEDNWEVVLRDWLNTILKTGPAAQVKWIEEIAKIGREKQKQFLRYFNHLLEQAIRIRVMGDSFQDVSSSLNENQIAINDFAIKINRFCDIAQQEAIIKEIDTATYHIERNANAKILFHSLTIKLYHIIRNKSVILVS